MLAGGRSVNLSLGLSVQQDAAGRLRGSGVTNIQVGNELVAASYRANGRITGGGRKATRAMLSVRWQSQGTGAGTNGPFTISAQYNLEVSRGSLDGATRGRAKFTNLGSGSLKSPVSGVPLPAGVDGSWSVKMNLQSPGGSGSIILPNGRSVEASLVGNFSPRSGVDRIKLSGVGSDRGNVLSINFSRATTALESLNGKILGQTVALKSLNGTILSQTISQASPSFAGSQACLECHTPVQQTLDRTRHAQVGVQCENCHGPAANHAANEYDPVARPIVNTTPLCGTCHSGPQHPTYEEWSASGHATLIGDLNPPNRISSCGRCHSGSVRVSLVDGAPLPVGHANVPIGCPTCHEPHKLTGLPDQLRNPLFSTNDYYLTTTEIFTNHYNPQINLCAQCHNHRGASWTESSAAPHPSPQYNMLLGTVGVLESGLASYAPSYHARRIPNQCAGCHMQTTPYANPAQPANTGHSFSMNSYEVCADCHGSAVTASNTVVFWSGYIASQIQTNQLYLDTWATNSSWARTNSALVAKYGTRAWEYTTPGALSPGGPGPDAAEQALIPDSIKKARFNLYLVLYDGSLGVHNPDFSSTLLETAKNWVIQELIE